jgi:glyoxylase-like metal-dependent hydrolase (beta-lactamase superfamily II)
MQVVNLSRASTLYTSNSYLVTGDWNASDDVITLIDPGRDPGVLDTILNRDPGRRFPVDLVLLTHTHYDHSALIPAIREAFSPRILTADPAFSTGGNPLRQGDLLKIGDVMAEVLATPGHSDDSVSFYCEEGGVLFVGDAPLFGPDSLQEDARRRLVASLEEMVIREVRTIYFGHGEPLISGCREFLASALRRLRNGGGTVPAGPP